MARNEQTRTIYSDWLSLRLSLLWCYDHKVAAGESGGCSVQRCWINDSAWLVRSGSAEVRTEGRTVRAGPAQWLIMPGGRYARGFAQPTHLLSVGFDAQWPDGQRLLGEGLPVVINASECDDLEKKAEKLSRLAAMPDKKWDTRKETVDCRTFLKLNAGMNDWFVTLLDALAAKVIYPNTRQEVDPRVVRAIRMLDTHPVGDCLDQEAVAAYAGLSLVHLVRLFRRHLRTTPKQYFEQRRGKYAMELLSLPQARPKEVAYGLGFKHLSHFSAWFKRISGTTPRGYMATVRF